MKASHDIQAASEGYEIASTLSADKELDAEFLRLLQTQLQPGKQRAPPIPVALAANPLHSWWRPGIPPLSGRNRDLLWNTRPTKDSLSRQREGTPASVGHSEGILASVGRNEGTPASVGHSEGSPGTVTGHTGADEWQIEGPQDTPEKMGNTSEGEGSLLPFKHHAQWEYCFEENYQGKGWTDIDTPPPEDGLLGNDPDLPRGKQEKAWMCKRKHPAGHYVMSGQRKTCVGCGGTKSRVLDCTMKYNIRWPEK